MPDSSLTLHEVKISELPVAPSVNDADQLEANQAGTSRSITVGQVKAAAVAAVPPNALNVKSFGAKGDGTTDDTAAIQAAISAAENFNPGSAPAEGARRCLFFPAGVYLTGALVITHKLALKGEGWMATMLKLKAGVTTSMFTINAEDIPGTSVDNLNHTLFEDMQFYGNRVDGVTTGNSHGIYCPDAPFPATTQYGPSFIGNRLVISGFTGNGIYVGVNRNWMELNSVTCMYNNTNGVLSFSYDHLVNGCSFGNNVAAGWRAIAGGGVEINNTTIFYNGTYGIILNTNVAHTYHFTNGCCDFNGQGGASLSSSVPAGQYTFTNWRFNDNSTTAPGTFSHILASAVSRIAVVGCQFLYTVNQAKYLVETTSVTSVQWSGNTVSSTGTLPYSVAPFSDFSVINADANYQTNVKFPATQVSSADANTLDDYEEGSWTPTVTSTGGGAATYSVQVGRYTKIGNQVTAHFQVQISAHTGSGTMSIGGLPFVAETVASLFFTPTFGLIGTLTLTANNVLGGIMSGGSQAILLYQYPAGGGSSATVPLDTACQFVGSITYRTAS